jgi:hypothetical protein
MDGTLSTVYSEDNKIKSLRSALDLHESSTIGIATRPVPGIRRFAAIRNTNRSRIPHPQFHLLIASESHKENSIKRVTLLVDHSFPIRFALRISSAAPKISWPRRAVMVFWLGWDDPLGIVVTDPRHFAGP